MWDNITIHDLVLMSHVFNKKYINTFDVLTYIQVRTDKQSSYRQEEDKNGFIQIRIGKPH